VAIRTRTSNASDLLIERIQQRHPAPEPSLLELLQGLAEDSARPLKTDPREDRQQALQARVASILSVAAPSEIDLALFAGFTHGAENLHRPLASQAALGKFGSLARKTAAEPAASEIAKACAFKVLAYLSRTQSAPTILEFLLPSHPEAVQRAAARALVESGEAPLFAAALKSWDQYQISTRRQLLTGAARSPETAAALIDQLKAERMSPAEIDPFLRQNLLRIASKESKANLQQLLGPAISTNRAAVIEKFTASLQMTGDKGRGRELFEKSCAQCHSFAGFTGKVGPNLSGINARPKEALLVDILDPSRQVPPEFLSYTVTITEGESITGLVLAESPASVTLRRPNLPDDTIPRSRIKTIQPGKLSLMPDGLDAGMTLQDMADLLQFLSEP
jgi:putative heme-binding domain-containing protein